MSKHNQYPDECPVFDIDGYAVEVRPRFVISLDDTNDLQSIDTGEYCLSMVDDLGSYMGLIAAYPRAKPLTDAARELLDWARQ